MKYYVVRVGRVLGIYTSWNEYKEQIHKFPKAEFKSFFDLEEAENYNYASHQK